MRLLEVQRAWALSLVCEVALSIGHRTDAGAFKSQRVWPHSKAHIPPDVLMDASMYPL